MTDRDDSGRDLSRVPTLAGRVVTAESATLALHCRQSGLAVEAIAFL